MNSISSYGSLSGSFRLTNREYGAVNYLRYAKRMNIAHIAKILDRSLSTIHHAVSLNILEHLDNRGQSKTEAKNRNANFSFNEKALRIRIKMWLIGLCDTIKEAMQTPLAPLPLIVTENTGDEQDEDPA